MVIKAYADGGILSANPSQVGGMWACCHVDEHDERIFCLSGLVFPEGSSEDTALAGLSTVSNNISELIAALRCFENLPEGWSGHFYTDSFCTLQRMKNDTASFAGVPKWLVDRVQRARRRLGTPDFTLLGGHPTKADLECGIRAARPGKSELPCSIHNVWCDLECNRLKDDFYGIMPKEKNPKKEKKKK